MKKSVAAWIALGLITVIAGLLLAITNEVTKGKIEAQAAEAKIEARKSVLSTAAEFELLELEDLQPLEDLYIGKSGETITGYVGAVVTKEGYGGPIEVIAGVDAQGKVTGVSVGGSEFSETAGLGAKAKEPAFMQQFIGKQTPVRAVKFAQDRADNTIDAITAATKTTNAVAGAVNAIAAKVDAYLNPETDVAAEGTTYTASVQGFAGPVAVLVTVKDNGAISDLTVGDDQFAETDGYGARAKDPVFTKQFVGKSLPITIEDIDALSGATRTSVAVVDAINKAYEDKVVVAPPAPEGTRYTVSEQGFAGPVAVFVTAKDDGTITALSIGDDQFKETEGYGAGAREPAFIKQFIGKQLPLTLDAIDAISGATRTSTAVVNAINRAYEEKLVDAAGEQQPPAEGPAVMEEPAAMEAPAATDAPVEDKPIADDRIATASVDGFIGPVAVTITLNADDTLAKVEVGDAQFNETEGLGSKARDEAFTAQFVGKKLPLTMEDIDAIAGATVTSKAVVEAINAAYKQLSK
ncbi:MAG: FMN-binding protein [Clostridiales bacterium]|nr:FMN-binding protein [Clostridiales bacterium]